MFQHLLISLLEYQESLCSRHSAGQENHREKIEEVDMRCYFVNEGVTCIEHMASYNCGKEGAICLKILEKLITNLLLRHRTFSHSRLQ